MIKTKMTSRIETIINLSRNAENEHDWEKIDQKIQSLNDLDPNSAGKFVLNFATDQDPRVRDTTATILEYLDLNDPDFLTQATEKMILQAAQDEDIFASGRAATFLLKHSSSSLLAEKIQPAINIFSSRVRANNWRDELLENIPNEPLHHLLVNTL
jgi:hypothetical protein